MAYYYIPQHKHNPEGKCRRVGFELEFGGPDIKTAASLVAQALDAKPQMISEAEWEVSDKQLGNFLIELDWHFAKETAKERADQKEMEIGAASTGDSLMEWVTKLASQVVPIEVVCPPIPMDRLERLDTMIAKLREGGAEGTEQALIYAFGVHINPELPALDTNTIIAYLQSYILAEEWLMKKHRVDLARRVTPYIDTFSKDYGLLVASYDEPITQDRLIDDYLSHNPTRNRALDLLPLFKHLDAEKIERTLSDPRIKARPAFHYRLPNCEIEQDEWSLHNCWNIWCVIEYLSENPEKRRTLIKTWCEYQNNWINLSEKSWHRELDTIYQSLL